MGEIKTIKVGNYIVNYYDENSGRPKIFFCHAFSSNYSNILAYAHKNRSFDIISPDFPGHGLTSNIFDDTQNVPNAQTLQDFAIAFLEAIDDDKIVLAVGHSLGGIGALSSLETKYVKRAALLGPYNYVSKVSNHYRSLKKWLLPTTFKDAFDSNLHLSTDRSERYYRSCILRASARLKSVDDMLQRYQTLVDDLFNHDTLNNFAKKLYSQNKDRVAILAGSEDEYVLADNLLKIHDELGIDVQVVNSGHIYMHDAKKETLQFIEEQLLLALKEK